MGSIPGPCFYRRTGVPCGYCRFESNLLATPRDYAETACAAALENPGITITLTGGAARNASDSVLRFLPYVRSINDATDHAVPIEVECPPPSAPSVLAHLVNAGASSFSINLELFDECARHVVCPGKSAIPRDDYFNAWAWIAENVGPFRAASVLIFGLESMESTRTGILDLLERRVRPNVLPFKPMTGSSLASRDPTNPGSYTFLMQSVTSALRESGIPRIRIGCATCSACSIEADVVGGSS